MQEMSERSLPYRRRTGDISMNGRWDTFTRIWAKGKNGKMRMRLMAKCSQRSIEPTEENCRDYWMGYVRYYVDSYTGQSYHL